MLLLIHLARCRFSMAMHGFDIAVGMSPEVCRKRVHIITVAAQYVLSQNKIDAILHDEELDSYLFTFGEAPKALTIFSSESDAWLGTKLEEGKTILDR